MAQQIIDITTNNSTYTGDTPHVAFEKINDNFNEVYSFISNPVIAGGVLQIGASTGHYAKINYDGVVTRSVASNPPGSSSLTISTSGDFGGGFGMIDGTNVIGLWSTSGALSIGFGTTTSALASKLTLATDGNLTISGTLTQSDYRLKKELEEIDPSAAYESVIALRPIRYVRTDVPEDQRRVTEGIIAHELAAAIPNLVIGTKDQVSSVNVYDASGAVTGTRSAPVYQTVDYTGITIEIAAAFKHLDSLVKAQAATIDALTARVAALESPATASGS